MKCWPHPLGRQGPSPRTRLLDDPKLSPDTVLAVVSLAGETRIAPLGRASRDALRGQIFTAGELLRLDQLEPDREALQSEGQRQADLFGEAP